MRHFSLFGQRLEYLWHGPAATDAPTLVFLHEGLGSARLWRDFPMRLADRLDCGALVYSRLGYGGSDPIDLPRPTDYHSREARDVLAPLLDQLGIGDHVLIGHSDGATIALLSAAHWPAPGLKGVVAEAPHIYVEDVTVQGIAAARVQYSKGLRDRLERHHGPNVDIAFHGWNDTWLRPDFRDWNISASLPSITCPVQIIQGEDDEYATLRQIEDIINGLTAPVDLAVLPNCGHTPHKDQEQKVMDAMADFIAPLLG